MRVLLDTHALLWFIEGESSLPASTRQLLDDPDTQKFVSSVSFWELSIKTSLGKLKLTQSPSIMYSHILQSDTQILGIQPAYLTSLESLPLHHRDPFDRLLIATALAEQLVLVSTDRYFQAYEGLSIIWD